MAKYKSMLKSELADAAGVSLSTFSSWLRNDQDILRSVNLSRNGIKKKAIKEKKQKKIKKKVFPFVTLSI